MAQMPQTHENVVRLIEEAGLSDDEVVNLLILAANAPSLWEPIRNNSRVLSVLRKELQNRRCVSKFVYCSPTWSLLHLSTFPSLALN